MSDVSGSARVAIAATLLSELVGVILLGGAFWLYQQSDEALRRSWPAPGAIIGFERAEPENGVAREEPVVRFRTPDGEAHIFRARTLLTVNSYQLGEQVTVLYDPRDPARAWVDEFWDLWLAPLALAALGTPLILGPALAFIPIRRRAA